VKSVDLARPRQTRLGESPLAHDRRARNALIVSVVLTAALYALPDPYGFYASYPFLLLSTLAHELGHGVAGVLVGADFDRFVMYADGSGAALLRGEGGRLAAGAIAAGGLVGPAVVAGLSFVLARRDRWAKAAFLVFGVLLGLAVVLVVRNLFGLFFVGAVTAACLLLGSRVPAHVSQVALLFVAVQLALSVFSRGDYLFTDVAMTAVGPRPSDVANMADALFLPYWFWGAACGLFSLVVLAAGLLTLLRRRG
jgi:hypothetical protein